MRKIVRLKRKARKSALNRDHRMSRFKTLENTRGRMTAGRVTAEAKCKDCDMTVVVNDWPLANEIEIGGTAVAVDCPQTLFPSKGKS